MVPASSRQNPGKFSAFSVVVMPGLVPGIHVFGLGFQDVDGRDRPGHDECPVFSPRALTERPAASILRAMNGLTTCGICRGIIR
jgi:hypothetical protein